MKLRLVRQKYTTHSTIGELYVVGADGSLVHQCYTLEDTVRPDGVKIYGETAIPAGTYDIQLQHSHRFNRVLPRLQDVPNFVGILIHPGNTPADTKGCILVGLRLDAQPDKVDLSRAAFDALFTKMLHVTGSITIEVVDTNDPAPVPAPVATTPVAPPEQHATT